MLMHYDSLSPLYVLGTGVPAQRIAHNIQKEYQNQVHLVSELDFLTVPVDSYCFFGFANPEYRKYWLSTLKINNYKWVSYLHPTALVDDISCVGKGCHIDAFSYLMWGTQCGEFTKICESVTVGHGTTLGRNVFVGPGSTLGGSSTIGDNVYLGMRSVVKDKISITNDCVFSMNTVIRKSVDEPGKYYNVNRALHKF